ncbi:MAG: type III pantothenate kinase [Eggerthellaceae bacterium]|nr:type III pantothenate kinase [Eggerthellaceae bacterium]
MLLTVDVGNTQTALGLYEGEALRHKWRMTTNKTYTADEVRIKLLAYFRAEGLAEDAVCGAALASVVPRLTASWLEACSSMLGYETLVVNAETASPLFKTSYRNPAEIGADRVADAVAAVARYGAPVVVVDFGTATNIEIIDKEGFLVGGIIAPGMETSAAALFTHASRLSATELTGPSNAIGRTTEEAVRSGIVYGEADRADGLVRRVFAELGYEAPVIATGGLSSTVAKASTTISDVNPELTLEGLRLIYHSCGAGRKASREGNVE